MAAGRSTHQYAGRRDIHANGFFVFFFAQHELLLRSAVVELERC
jgi:hypothetical protein